MEPVSPGLNETLLTAAIKKLLLNSDEYIFVVDKELVYQIASDPVARIAGFASGGELVGKTDFDIFPQALAEKYSADDRRVMETGIPIVGMVERLPDKEGQKQWTKTWKYALYDDSGRLLGLYGISRDVTQLIGLEDEVETAKKYIDIIQRIPGGLAILHEKDEVFFLDYANAGYYSTHYMSEEYGRRYLGAGIVDIIYGPDLPLFAEAYKRIKDRIAIQGTIVYRIRGEDGQLHWINLQYSPAYEDAGIQYYYACFICVDEQKKAEDELVESRNILQEAIMNSDIQFFTYFSGKRRCELYAVNKRLADLPTEWNNFPDDFLAYTQASAADTAAYRKMLAEIDAGQDEAGCTVRLSYHGIYAWEQLHIKAVRDADGRLIRGQGYSFNISFQKEAEEKLYQERLRLKSLEGNVVEAFAFNLVKDAPPDIQTSDECFFAEPLAAEFIEASLRLAPFLGDVSSGVREILLRTAARIPSEADRLLFFRTCSGNAMCKAVKTGRYREEIRYRRRIGELVRWVATKVEVLPDPETADMIAFFYTRDINEDVIFEKMSRQITRRNYETVSICDLQTGRMFVKTTKNQLEAAFIGAPYEKYIASALARLADKMDKPDFVQQFSLATIKAELADKAIYTVYSAQKAADGQTTRQLKHDMFYLDEYQDVIVFLSADVTDIFAQERENRDKMATALAAARQASMAKSNFLSRMSHEIRTPLNAIIGMGTIAAQSLGNREKEADCIAKIGISARYLLSLINDILDMSRIESGKMLLKNEKFLFRDFITNVNTVIFNQTKAKGLDFECTVSHEIAEAYVGDAMKLQQVLINILGNAVKFTDKGKVSFDVHLVAGRGSQTQLRFTVNDTGIGIREEFLDKLFDPFEQFDTSTTTTFGGTGLGLAITKNLVALMGGSIRVRSIVGVGSEFTVDVPLAVAEDVLVQPQLKLHFDEMYALIVDDDLVVCEQASNILRDIGMVGDWVTTGQEAVEKVESNYQREHIYDFILIDWKMPDMDGIETTRQIRRIVGPDVTIIIITAYDWESIEVEAKAAGANLLISKPLLKTTLVSAFQKARGQIEVPPPQEQDFDFSGKRVLVAEDNQINAEIARSLLEHKSFTVELAVNGQKALELYAQNPPHYYDAILMDIRMPLMDGLQTTTNIRHWNKEDAKTIPIIAMTANAFDEDVEKSLAAGMNAHLSKPIEPVLLYSTLYRMLFEAAVAT